MGIEAEVGAEVGARASREPRLHHGVPAIADDPRLVDIAPPLTDEVAVTEGDRPQSEAEAEAEAEALGPQLALELAPVSKEGLRTSEDTRMLAVESGVEKENADGGYSSIWICDAVVGGRRNWAQMM